MEVEQAQDARLSIAEAAAALGAHPQTLRRWDRAGLLEAERTPGGHRRYRRSAIEKLLERAS